MKKTGIASDTLIPKGNPPPELIWESIYSSVVGMVGTEIDSYASGDRIYSAGLVVNALFDTPNVIWLDLPELERTKF